MGSIRECQAVTELEPEAFNHQTRDLLDHLAASVYKLTRTTRPPAAGRPPPPAIRSLNARAKGAHRDKKVTNWLFSLRRIFTRQGCLPSTPFGDSEMNRELEHGPYHYGGLRLSRIYLNSVA